MLAEYDIHYSNEKILNCFPNYDINPGESFFKKKDSFRPFAHWALWCFSAARFSFVRPAQMENVWWISLFINMMSFHRLHNPFRLNWLEFSFRASFGSGNLSRLHIHGLDWDKRCTYSVFSTSSLPPFNVFSLSSPLIPPLPLPHTFISPCD